MITATVAVWLVAMPAYSHVNEQSGGPGNDTMDGHGHVDKFHGGAGCDDLLGRDDADKLWGDNNGCDVVRGMANGDQVNTYEDSVSGDNAFGGDGLNDVCNVNLHDNWDNSCDSVNTIG